MTPPVQGGGRYGGVEVTEGGEEADGAGRAGETYRITLSGDALTKADQLFPPFRLFPG